ncbi:hypothetical protein [Pedobacter sp. Leaf250]|uniref:hypothetical protein n=1 Tax=Pedobacter sp. Leaf250 TaxID=2876559 RepID=UPI001E4C6B80|nr:hypothetical protein [Pedobacter sp. Leaf250]
MTTREAFAQLVERRGWHRELGISDSAAYSAKNHFKTGEIAIEKMEELLEKAGFKVIQEKKWEKKI